MSECFKYYAFISYSSKDTGWGKRLQRKLEHYRMPSLLCHERGWKRKPINPVFFAPTDIQPGGLDEELKERLRISKNLIVICSPNSAQSTWVGKEIEYFHELGRDRNIHFFIVDGVPNSGDSATECFNPIVKKLGLPEILGANIHERIYRCPWINRERAYVQLVSKLLDVDFDTIWKRHRRRLVAQMIAWTIGTVAILTAMLLIWINNQPFNATISLKEVSVHNPNLPPLRNAIISLITDEETKTDTIAEENGSVIFKNLPHKYLGKKVRFSVSCQDFNPVDTTLTLTKSVVLNISRNPSVYGSIRTELFDFTRNLPVANTKVIIEQWETQSDSMGIVKYFVNLELQKSKYLIFLPDYCLTDTIYMPSGESDVIDVE